MQLVGVVLTLLLLTGCGGTANRPAGPQGEGQSRGPSPSPSTSPTSAPSSSASARLTTARCADLVVLGLRGQGQSARGHHGAGRDADGVMRAMLPHLRHGTTLRIEGVPYPARSGGDAAYSEDVRTGVRLVDDQLTELRKNCPSSRVGLVGYSEGAEVVHRAATAAGAGRLAVVVLMGDPQRNPADPVATLRLGTAALTGQGNGGVGARFPDAVRHEVLEVCAQGDDVCNAPPTGRVGPPSATHRAAYKHWATQRRVAVEAARVVVGGGG